MSQITGRPTVQSLMVIMLAAPLLLGARGCEEPPPNSGPVHPEPDRDGGAAPGCYVGGCSSQLCTEDPDVVSTCEWLDEYACYREATCERQADGACGWTRTPELEACLDDPKPVPPPHDGCHVGGCSGQLCSEDPGAASTCEWLEEYACYRSATCERQADGACGWTATPELEACLADPPGEPEPPPAPSEDCFIGGCSSQICSDTPGVVSTCEWTDAYACYRGATCERQADGACGWTRTRELEACLSATGS